MRVCCLYIISDLLTTISLATRAYSIKFFLASKDLFYVALGNKNTLHLVI